MRSPGGFGEIIDKGLHSNATHGAGGRGAAHVCEGRGGVTGGVTGGVRGGQRGEIPIDFSKSSMREPISSTEAKMSKTQTEHKKKRNRHIKHKRNRDVNGTHKET